jgi:SAM-dependent methyltransferase
MLLELSATLMNGITIRSQEGVWPPSKFGLCLASLVSKMNCSGKYVLDIGCGSGIQAIVAAKCGAVVCASDLSAQAVSCTAQNAHASNVAVETRNGAGLAPWQGQAFDLIICNGPTYESVAGAGAAGSGIAQRLRPISLLALEVFERHDEFLNPGGRIAGLVCGPYAPAVVRAAAEDNGLHIELLWALNFDGSLEEFGGQFDPVLATASGFARESSDCTFSIRAATFVARRNRDVAMS